ncbi:MAG: hypothetical protein, partial [Olavius algarvensis spirochete endosymbiont]
SIRRMLPITCGNRKVQAPRRSLISFIRPPWGLSQALHL